VHVYNLALKLQTTAEKTAKKILGGYFFGRALYNTTQGSCNSCYKIQGLFLHNQGNFEDPD